MSAASRQMHLAILINGMGNQMGAWRMPEAETGAVDFDLLKRITHSAERGKFDMIFLADGLSSGLKSPPTGNVNLEVLTVLAGLSAVTTHIGLAATASTTYSEPYNLARMFSSIDHMSGGRSAWNAVTTATGNAAANFGLDEHPPKAERYERAGEFLEVTKALWDSWEDGAVLQDKASGRWVDLAKRHEINHKGKFYSVKGPLNVSRMPQGHPVIIQAGASDVGLPFAAAYGEVIFIVQDEMETAKEFRTNLRAAAAKMGRDPSQVKVLPGLSFIVADTEEEGREIYAKLARLTNPDHAWSQLSVRLGMDVSHLPPDGPIPEVPPELMRGYGKTFLAAARKNNFNLGQLRDYAAVSGGHHVAIGPAEKIADHMEKWFEEGAADGFMMLSPWFTSMFDRFVDEVVPVLQRRGLFRKDYSGTMLRDHLGLNRPPNQFEQLLRQAG